MPWWGWLLVGGLSVVLIVVTGFLIYILVGLSHMWDGF